MDSTKLFKEVTPISKYLVYFYLTMKKKGFACCLPAAQWSHCTVEVLKSIEMMVD